MRNKATPGSRLLCVKNALTRNYIVISDVAGDGAAVFQVLLVVLLGAPKGACGDDLGCNWCAKTPFSGTPGDGLAGGRFLFGRMEEDDRPVLLAPVGSLAVDL